MILRLFMIHLSTKFYISVSKALLMSVVSQTASQRSLHTMDVDIKQNIRNTLNISLLTFMCKLYNYITINFGRINKHVRENFFVKYNPTAYNHNRYYEVKE